MSDTGMPHLDSYNLSQVQSLVALVNGKPFHEFTIPEQRELFKKAQLPRTENTKVSVTEHAVETQHGVVKTYLYVPESVDTPVPFIYYLHGGGWIYGGSVEYEEFPFELATLTGFAIVVPEYTLAPDRQYPTQQEQCLEVLQQTLEVGADHGLLTDKVVLAADSSGGEYTSQSYQNTAN
jgi:acetyl esterase